MRDGAVTVAGQLCDLGAQCRRAGFVFADPTAGAVDVFVERVDGVAVAEPRPRAVESVEPLLRNRDEFV